MTRRTGNRQIVISAVVLTVASAVVGLVMVASRSTSSAMAGMSGMSGMAGMDHGSGDTSTSSPAAADAGGMPGMDMPGMDSGSGDATAGGPPPTGSGDMAGMNMDPGAGYADVPATSPAPAPAHGSGDMPGMDMPGMDSGSGDAHGTSSGHAMAGEVGAARPLAPVLGTFGGGTSAVMLTAVFLRRRDRARRDAKEATRAARRTQK